MIDHLAPLSSATELAQTDAMVWTIILTKFNVIFLGAIGVVTAYLGRFDSKHIMYSALVSFCGVFTVDPLGALIGLSNPQQLVIYPLIILTIALSVQALFSRWRTMARLMMAVVSFAVLLGSVLIHLSVINIKMDSQARMLADYHHLMVESTFRDTEQDEKKFITLCKLRNTYCKTNSMEYMPELDRYMTEEDVKGVVDMFGLNEVVSNDESRFVVFTNMDDLFGSEFQIGSYVSGGIERTVVDFHNMNKIHNESKNIVYIWIGILSMFWVYGGIYLYFFHEKIKARRR